MHAAGPRRDAQSSASFLPSSEVGTEDLDHSVCSCGGVNDEASDGGGVVIANRVANLEDALVLADLLEVHFAVLPEGPRRVRVIPSDLFSSLLLTNEIDQQTPVGITNEFNRVVDSWVACRLADREEMVGASESVAQLVLGESDEVAFEGVHQHAPSEDDVLTDQPGTAGHAEDCHTEIVSPLCLVKLKEVGGDKGVLRSCIGRNRGGTPSTGKPSCGEEVVDHLGVVGAILDAHIVICTAVVFDDEREPVNGAVGPCQEEAPISAVERSGDQDSGLSGPGADGRYTRLCASQLDPPGKCHRGVEKRVGSSLHHQHAVAARISNGKLEGDAVVSVVTGRTDRRGGAGWHSGKRSRCNTRRKRRFRRDGLLLLLGACRE
mmetsp:Transcript_47241/g.93201  ORF Transcript_47241/g.93201 Transcript_47241/m.93201 type:complete len:378 (+) Transcript_47241:675-1808(+)